ncbi:MAG: DEAD/DEAH box helicase [Candidatus Magasanikbacteria bacterium]|nr:DEAD/DEAH box helicase [Candidatus Magasanikbacteria bacterium]
MATFIELGLNPAILQALTDLGFSEPTPIQQKSIPHILTNTQDLIAFAQTGTGKTAAFCLPVIHNIDETSNEVQALVLCPTRELCLQITKDITSFTKHMPNVGVVAVYGGDPVYKQLQALKKKPQIVVGTPGRVADFVRKNKVDFSTVRFAILDEADEMLNMGFKEELDQILGATPKDKQTLLFSATMPKTVDRIAKKYMNNPLEISVAGRNQGASNVSHVYYQAHPRDRYHVLRRIVDMNSDMYGIVFCRTRNDCKELVTKLVGDSYAAEAIHGELDQNQREKVMTRFRKQKTKLLIATDVAARGIDVKNLTHVINFALPDQLESYVHRSGTTGRAGNDGVSIAFVSNRELRSIGTLERHMNKKFERGMIPTGEDVCKKQLFELIEKVKAVDVDESHIDTYLEEVYEKLSHFDRETIIKNFVSLEFSRVLSFYKGARDLNGSQSSRRDDRSVGNKDLKTLKVNLGKKDAFKVVDLFGLLNRHRKLKGAKVGNIHIQESSTLFEIDQSLVNEILICFNKAHFNRRKVIVGEGEQIQRYAPSRERSRHSRGSSRRRATSPSRTRGNYKQSRGRR